MSNTATWTNVLGPPPARAGSSVLRRATALSGVILMATLVLGAAIYITEKQALTRPGKHPKIAPGPIEGSPELFQRMDTLVLRFAELTLVGGIGALLPLITAARQRLSTEGQHHAREAREWQANLAALQSQLTDLRRTHASLLGEQDQLEEKVHTLTAANATLKSDLDKRNRAERLLSQRRQELESSKSVLELHVQARQAELQTLQRRYELILNAAGEGICGLDVDGRATFVNPTMAKLTGRAAGELIGKTEQEIFFANGEGGLSTQDTGEQVFHRGDGTWFPVEFVKTRIDENGKVIGSVLVFKDITERKRTEETLARKAAELARSNAELEQFAFVASHDLQEPLRKIQAFGDRLKTKCEGAASPEVRDYLERMQSAAARMRTLINDLLAFSRVIRSSEPLVAVDLNQVTREVLSDLEVRIEKTGAKVELGVLPTIDADPMQMRQLMLNLISNALKFQPAGNAPMIRIAARSTSTGAGEPLCEIAVQDNGIGFDEKYLDKMFAVFQRLHGRGEYEGTGVGLAVCRRIIDRHHGSIVAHSKPGEGATFTVTLPVHQPEPEKGSV